VARVCGLPRRARTNKKGKGGQQQLEHQPLKERGPKKKRNNPFLREEPRPESLGEPLSGHKVERKKEETTGRMRRRSWNSLETEVARKNGRKYHCLAGTPHSKGSEERKKGEKNPRLPKDRVPNKGEACQGSTGLG